MWVATRPVAHKLTRIALALLICGDADLPDARRAHDAGIADQIAQDRVSHAQSSVDCAATGCRAGIACDKAIEVFAVRTSQRINTRKPCCLPHRSKGHASRLQEGIPPTTRANRGPTPAHEGEWAPCIRSMSGAYFPLVMTPWDHDNDRSTPACDRTRWARPEPVTVAGRITMRRRQLTQMPGMLPLPGHRRTAGAASRTRQSPCG
jgi:hypothetical protein